MTAADIENPCKMEETQQEKNKIKNFVEDQGKKHPWEFASDALKTLDDSKSDGNTTSKTINNGIESFGGIRNNYSSHGNYPYPNRYMGNSHERFNAQYPQYPQYPPNNWYPPPGPGYRPPPYQYSYGIIPPNPYAQNYPQYYSNINYNNNTNARPYNPMNPMNNGYYNNQQFLNPQNQQKNIKGNKENNETSGKSTPVGQKDNSNNETLNKPQSFADAVKNNKLWKKKAVTNGNVLKQEPKSKPAWTQGGFQNVSKSQENETDIIREKRELTEGGNSTEPKQKQQKQENSPKKQETKKREWPAAMKEWVKASFEQCENERAKDRMEEKLKVFVNEVISDGTAWTTINWEMKSLFQVPSKATTERRKSQRTRKSRSNSRSRSRSRSPVRRRRASSSSDSAESLDNMRTPMSANMKSRIGKKQSALKKKTKANGTMKKQFQLPEDINTLRKKQDRAARFQKDTSKKSNSFSLFSEQQIDGIESDMMNFHINGYCTDLTKPYLRLTAAPDPATVRPQNILEKSLIHVKDHWKKNQDYHFACEQMKSIRQDLTVQGIENEFTVKVYECHARIALEKGDREEFNQCQTCLRRLYNKGVSGQVAEFTAYSVLYYIYTKSNTDLNSCLSSLTKELKKDDVVQHALAVRSACALCNYRLFFKLYATAPKMGGYLIDLFIDRERKEALKRMLKAIRHSRLLFLMAYSQLSGMGTSSLRYRPSLSISFVSQQLAFDNEELCGTWLRELNIAFLPKEPSSIDCKASSTTFT